MKPAILRFFGVASDVDEECKAPLVPPVLLLPPKIIVKASRVDSALQEMLQTMLSVAVCCCLFLSAVISSILLMFALALGLLGSLGTELLFEAVRRGLRIAYFCKMHCFTHGYCGSMQILIVHNC